MMQYEREGVIITETREEGITLQDAIRERYGKKKGVWPFRSVQAPEIPTPDLKFSSIDNVIISRDFEHVVATASDESQNFLVRDDKILLQGDFKIIIYESQPHGLDFSSLVAFTVSPQDGSWTLHHFDTDGNHKTVVEGMILSHDVDRDKILCLTDSPDGQAFNLVHLDSGQILYRFNTKGVDPLNTQFESYSQIIGAEPKIVWREKNNDVKPKYSLYLNSQLLATNVIAHEFEHEFSSYLLIRESETEGQIDVISNGDLLDSLLFQLQPCGDIYGGPIEADKTITWAAIGLTDGSHKWLFCITPKWHALLNDHPFDKDAIWVFDVTNEGIECTGKRNGIERTIKITLDNNGDPQVSEEAA